MSASVNLSTNPDDRRTLVVVFLRGAFDGDDNRQQRTFGGLQVANPCGNSIAGRSAVQQTPGGPEQHRSEEPGNPGKVLEERYTCGDEERAQDDCARYAPEQSRVLPAAADAKTGKKHQKDEEIIEAEGDFNGVAGDELQRGLATEAERDPSGKERGAKRQNRRP